MSKQKAFHIDDPVKVGLRIREARQAAKVTQADLAAAGCTAAYVSRIEKGERTPSLQLLRGFAKRLGVSDEFLARGNERTTMATALLDAEIALRLDEPERAGGLYETVLRQADDEGVRHRALEGLGHVAFRRGDYQGAIELLGESLAGIEPCERPEAAESLARAHAALGELAPAIAVLEHCAESYRERDPVAYVRFTCLLGSAHTDNGDFRQAETVIARALDVGREIADPYTRARLLWSQSRLRAEQGQMELAEQYACKSLETLRATEDSYAIAHMLETLAHITLELGEAAQALELLREGRPLIELHGTSADTARFMVEEARALAAIGEEERAADLAVEASVRFRDAEPVESGRAYVVLGGIFASLGDSARALEVLELAVDLLEQQPAGRHLVTAYRRLAEILKQQGDRDRALEILERAVAVQEKAGRPLS